MFSISNDIGKYIILVLLIVISVYITGRCFTFQRSILEGLANPNKNMLTENHFQNLEDNLDHQNDQLEDKLLVKKYKNNFEEMIVNLNRNTNLNLLKHQMEYGNALMNNNESDILKHLDKISKLHIFNSSLNASMKHVNTY